MGILHGPKSKEEPIMLADIIDPIHHSWNHSLLQQFFGDQITEEVLTIPVRPLYSEDKLIWLATKDGTHTVRSNYHTVMQSLSNQNNTKAATSNQHSTVLWKSIWAMKTESKIKSFLWPVCHNALASKANLF